MTTKTETVTQTISGRGDSILTQGSSAQMMGTFDALMAMKARGYRRISRERRNGVLVEVWAKKVKRD